MPVRKYQRKRKYVAKRKTYRPKVNNRVHHFKREVYLGQASTSITSAGVSTPYAQGFNFRLSDLPNVAEYSSLFDQYKINSIKFKIMPKTDNVANAANSSTISGFGQIVTVIDHDDVIAPTTREEMLQYGTAKVTSPSRQVNRSLRPTMLTSVFRVGLTAAYSVIPCKFLDMSYTDVPTYGVKVWIDGPVVNPLAPTLSPLTVIYDIYATYSFTCKATR